MKAISLHEESEYVIIILIEGLSDILVYGTGRVKGQPCRHTLVYSVSRVAVFFSCDDDSGSSRIPSYSKGPQGTQYIVRISPFLLMTRDNRCTLLLPYTSVRVPFTSRVLRITMSI